MIRFRKLGEFLDQQKGKKSRIEEQITEINEDLKAKKSDLINLEQAREIIKIVGLKTQESLQYHISDITSLALDSVFPDPYQLKVNFIERRNKTECDLMFEREGQEISPLDSSGYGAVDVASFALRVACWSMQKSRTRNTIILDEPMRFLSEDKQADASAMLKEISKKLKIQFIIVTHEQTLTHWADKIITVSKKDGKAILHDKED